MPKEERHPGTELLLRALDGELSSREAKAVQRHLQACWKCRMESDEIAKTVHAYTAFSTWTTSPERLQPPNGWAGFPAALHRLAEQPRAIKRRSLGRRFAPLFCGRVAFGFQAGALFVCAVLLWTKFTGVPSVSASELLVRATNDEASVQESLQTKRAPGVFQKVRYRMSRRMLTRSSYRDFRHHRRSERWESAEINTPERALTSNALRDEMSRWEKTMAQAHLSFDEPLSPRSFQKWLQQQRYPHHETVSRSEHHFRLISEIDAGPVHKAELVLRTPDYHPIQERFRFADDEELEITEVAYAVRPPARAEDYADAPVQIPVIAGAKKNSFATRRSARQADGENLEDAEMMARLILHRENADLGEQVEIERQRNVLTVSGIVETPERKTELTSALKSVAGVRLQLQTVEEASSQTTGNEHPRTTISESGAALEAPLLGAELKARFSSDEQRQEYVGRVLAASERVRSDAFALQELAQRYPPEVEAKLDTSSEQGLLQLRREHRAAMRVEQEQLRQLLRPFVDIDADMTDRPELSVDVWQRQAALVIARAQREHEDLVALLATSNAQERSVDEIKSELSGRLPLQ